VRISLHALVLCLISTCSAHASSTATLILFNGKIWTENSRQPEAEAVAIDGQHILAVGSSASIRALAGPDCKSVDLHGRRVVPGFNDSHVHLLEGGEVLSDVQLTDADSEAEFRRRIGDYAKKLKKGAWVRQGNWDHTLWSPVELPTRQSIDAVTPNNPVLVWRLDGHMALANSVALKLAGVDRNTPDVPGGEIVRDREGNPTGILKDEATILVEKVMPALTQGETDENMAAAMKEAARLGVTSVQNLVTSPVDANTAPKFREFQDFERKAKLTVRIYNSIPLRDWKELGAAGVQAGFGSASLRIGNLKGYADGALGSATAWMDAPFTDHPARSGLASTELADSASLYANIAGADKAGLQVSIHAIGDRANHAILDLFEKVEHANGPGDHRFRIEHAQHLRAADIPRFGALHVIASMQPYHAIDDGRWAEKIIGPERIKTSYAWHSLLEHGAVLAFGSDWPVAPLDPISGIYAAVTRRTLDGKNPQGWIPGERITVAQAVHAYTMGSAFAEHQETVKGSIEVGKLADLAVLSGDIFHMPPEKIQTTRVVTTVFDGKIIYESDR